MKPGYIEHNGETLFIGRYTLEIRNAYMLYRTERFLIDHPQASRAAAGRAARLAWRNKAKASMKGKNDA